MRIDDRSVEMRLYNAVSYANEDERRRHSTGVDRGHAVRCKKEDGIGACRIAPIYDEVRESQRVCRGECTRL